MQCGLVLCQRRLRLRDLVVEFGGGDFRQQGAGLDLIADVYIPLFDIAARSSEDICRLKGGCRCRQRDGYRSLARADCRDAHTWLEGTVLFGGYRHTLRGFVVMDD